MSFVGITEIPKSKLTRATDSVVSDRQATTPTTATNLNTTTANPVQRLQGPIKAAIMTAVHAQLKIKDNRKNNIVVTGLPMDSVTKDDALFDELCHVEFQMQPNIIHCKRFIG